MRGRSKQDDEGEHEDEHARKESSASPEAGSCPSRETKGASQGRKKRSKPKLERSAARIRSCGQMFSLMQSPDFVPGRSEALTFLFAAIRGFQKTLRKIC
jgi:hypothetical protein